MPFIGGAGIFQYVTDEKKGLVLYATLLYGQPDKKPTSLPLSADYIIKSKV
jgi:hypothetical protein